MSEPAPLKPSGPWIVDYADSMCVLQREFADGNSKVALGFRPGPASDYMRVLLQTPGTSTKVVRGDAKLEFDAGPPVSAPFIAGPVNGKPMRLITIDLQRPEIAPLQSAKLMRVRAGKVDVKLAPSQVVSAMKALRVCEDDLMVTWGMDAATVASLASFAQAPNGPMRFFSTQDYPMESIRKAEQGTVGVRYWVGEDGKVSDCRIVESSGSERLDRQTCAVLVHRGRFEPARTRDGRIVASILFQRVRWELPQ